MANEQHKTLSLLY